MVIKLEITTDTKLKDFKNKVETGGHRLETKEVVGWKQKRHNPWRKLPAA